MRTQPDVLIRLASLSDLEFIQRCAVAAYSKYIERIGKPPAPMEADFSTAIRSGTVSVVLTGEVLAGYVVFYPVDDEMHLENVAVLPEHSGKGLGRSLILHVEDEAKTASIKAVSLYTNEAMTENLKLYPRFGYTEFKRSSAAGFKRVYFRKAL